MAKSICLVATLELVALFLALTIFASSGAFIITGTPEQISIGDEHHQTPESAVSVGNNKIAKDLEHSLGKPLTTMSFAGTSAINVYRIQGRKNYHSKYLYQFSPAAILDRSTITQWYSGVNSQHYFGFRVQMWNETIQQAVASHLTRVTGRKVRTYQVQSIPFDRVILSILTRTDDEEEDERFQIAQPWIPYTQTVGFSLACFDKSECQQLVEQFKNEPEKFDKFKLAYSIDSRRQTENRTIQVTQSMLTQTNQLFSQISKRFTKTSEILLTVSDAQRLLWHAVSDICRDNFRDQPEAIVPRESHKIIYDHLEKATVAAKLTISTADDAKWSTVYWEDPLSRPDAIARSLNERKRHLLRHDVEMDDDFDVREDDNHQVSGSSRDWKMRAKEAIDALYEQNKDLVTFNGEKFVPKPIQLYKIKLNAIRENRIWKDLGRIEVSFHPEVDMTGPIIHSSQGLILPSSGIQSY